MARPTTYSKELCEQICSQVADGKNIKTVLNSDDNYPSFQTWCNWKRANKELLDLYICSICDKAESVDNEIDSIINDVKTGKIEANVARVIIDTLKWKAAKYYPKMFGTTNIDIKSDGEKLESNTIDLSHLTEAEKISYLTLRKKSMGISNE